MSAAQKTSRIMLIDDEPGVIFALKLMLEALGAEVNTFSEGLSALEALKIDSAYDFILCDLRMPEIDGFAVLKAVKNIYPSLYFILISGHASNEDILKAEALGMDRFLAKPFSGEEITALINETK
ncbi:MAG: response regulator [bacterium]|nr:response regulator [bacterium]